MYDFLFLLFLPDYFFYAVDKVEVSGEDEKVVGESVDITYQGGIHIALVGQGDDPPFCGAACGTGHVGLGAERASAG